MPLSLRPAAFVRFFSILAALAALLPLTAFLADAQEQQQRWQLFVTPPENARAVWYLQARHVASALELDREAARNLTRTYISARQEHLTKIEALPKTQESGPQFWQLRNEAADALEKSLGEALGEEKGKKAAAALGGFSLFFDNIVADVLASQTKTLAALFKYEEGVGKVMKETRETGSWEGVREKLRPLVVELGKQATLIYSQDQMNEWGQKYGWFFERILSE